MDSIMEMQKEAFRNEAGGLDEEAIRRAAEKRGLIQPGAALTRTEAQALIMQPGFSTSGAVSDVSGRGVGMDAVKQAVEECVLLGPERAAEARKKEIMNYRGAPIPYFSLRERFNLDGDPPEAAQTVVARTDGAATVGFEVDAIIGGCQTVIKPLGGVYKGVRGLSGAAILGDGAVALVLDVNQI